MKNVPYVNIENIVCSVYWHRELDLNKIVSMDQTVEYRPEQFPGLVYRTKNPKTANLIFNSGKMVCTGAKTVKDAKKAVKKVKKDVIEKYFGKQPRTPDFSVQNIVASCDFYGNILLDYINRLYGSSRYSVMYEPDQFPGAIVRDKQKVEIIKNGEKILSENSSVFLVFASGKVIATGCKTEESLISRTNDLYKTLFDLGLLVENV